MGQKSRQGVFITTGRFSADAEACVTSLADHRVVLIGGERLADPMIDFDVGVTELERIIIKKLHRDYFEE